MKSTKLLAASALFAASALVLLPAQAEQDQNSQSRFEERPGIEHRQQRGLPILGLLRHSDAEISNTDTGIVGTITFDDEQLARFTEHQEKLDESLAKLPESVSVEYQLNDHTLTVSASSSDEDQIERLQHMTSLEKPERPEQDEFKGLRDSITHTVEQLDNGVRVTLTTDDALALEKLQNKLNEEHPAAKRFGANVEVTSLDNGIELMITSDDPEVVEKIQAGPERGEGMKGKRHHKHEVEELDTQE